MFAGWLNELGRWIQQLIQAYHQYGVHGRSAMEANETYRIYHRVIGFRAIIDFQI